MKNSKRIINNEWIKALLDILIIIFLLVIYYVIREYFLSKESLMGYWYITTVIFTLIISLILITFTQKIFNLQRKDTRLNSNLENDYANLLEKLDIIKVAEKDIKAILEKTKKDYIEGQEEIRASREAVKSNLGIVQSTKKKVEEIKRDLEKTKEVLTKETNKEITKVKDALLTFFSEDIKQQVVSIYPEISEVSESGYKKQFSENIFLVLNRLISLYELSNKLELKEEDIFQEKELFALGIGFYKNKKYDKSISLFAKVLGLNPNNEKAYVKQGVSYANIKNNKKALECFNKALKLEQNNPIIHFNKAEILQRMKEYESSILSFKKCLELDHKYLQAFTNLGNVYYKIKEYDKALQHYGEAKKLKEDYSVIYYNSACVYADTQEEKDTILTELKRAIDLDEKLYLTALKDETFKIYWEDIKMFADTII